MKLLVAAIVNGMTLGGIVALIALGMVLVFRATRTFNFAHGELMLLPAFLVGFAEVRHVSPSLAILLAIVVDAVIGATFYFLALRRTIGSDVFMGVIATFGLATSLDGIMGVIFGADLYTVTLPGVPHGSATMFGASVSQSSLVLAAVTVALALLVSWLMRYTHLGLMVRAAGQNPQLASQCGINVRGAHLGSWIAAGVLASIAGIAYGSTASVNLSLVSVGLTALPAIAIGGMDSIGGAIIGGLVVGLIQSFVQIYWGGQYVDAITYVSMLLILLVYPAGFFGSREVVRA